MALEPSGVMELLARQIISSPENQVSTSNPVLYTDCLAFDRKCGAQLKRNREIKAARTIISQIKNVQGIAADNKQYSGKYIR